jgi:hypothetical protein
MWRDDPKIAANGSGLRLVSYDALEANQRRLPPDSRGRSASADGLPTTTRARGKKKKGLCHVLVLDVQIPIQAMVVNVAEKPEQDSGRHDWERRTQVNRR